MRFLIENPITIWLYRAISAIGYELKNKNLRIGYMSQVQNVSFGQYNTIYKYVSLNHVCLGDLTYIAHDTQISRTTIGKFCSIGPHCQIGLGKHPSNQFVSTHPAFFSPLKQAQISFTDTTLFDEYSDIRIANDVWVGSHAIILDGVTINNGAIIAAGSIVTKDVPAYAIVAGIPAKIIKYRFSDDEIICLLKTTWWEKDIETIQQHHKQFLNIEDFMRSDLSKGA